MIAENDAYIPTMNFVGEGLEQASNRIRRLIENVNACVGVIVNSLNEERDNSDNGSNNHVGGEYGEYGTSNHKMEMLSLLLLYIVEDFGLARCLSSGLFALIFLPSITLKEPRKSLLQNYVMFYLTRK